MKKRSHSVAEIKFAPAKFGQNLEEGRSSVFFLGVFSLKAKWNNLRLFPQQSNDSSFQPQKKLLDHLWLLQTTTQVD